MKALFLFEEGRQPGQGQFVHTPVGELLRAAGAAGAPSPAWCLPVVVAFALVLAFFAAPSLLATAFEHLFP